MRANIFLELLFPEKCAFCHRVIKSECGGICEKCRSNLPYTHGNCKKKGDYFTLCVAPLYYEGDVRESLLRYKFGRCTAYAGVYAPMVSACIEREFGQDFDLLSWVPVSRRRLRRRGYDQAQLLADEIGRQFAKKPVPLLKKRHVPAQSGMGSMEKRRANISGAYRVIDPELIAEKRILIIDDIVTTGSTLSECAKTLMRAGANKVMCAAVARDRD
ncbi:MAG: ComF family protein [Oscillospiraceae bacterium]